VIELLLKKFLYHPLLDLTLFCVITMSGAKISDIFVVIVNASTQNANLLYVAMSEQNQAGIKGTHGSHTLEIRHQQVVVYVMSETTRTMNSHKLRSLEVPFEFNCGHLGCCNGRFNGFDCWYPFLFPRAEDQ